MGLQGQLSCIWIPGHVPKSNWWPRLRKELLIDWNNPSSIPPFDKDYLDEIHSVEWYHDTYKLYNIQDSTFVVLYGLIFSWTILMLQEMTARVLSV
jgi:hypothetical protein